MSIVSKIKELCSFSANTKTIQSLEQKVGLSNGSISKWDKSSPKIENVQKVADYFGVSVDYLLGREQTDDVTDEDLMYALFGGEGTDAQLEEVKKYAAFIKQRDKE